MIESSFNIQNLFSIQNIIIYLLAINFIAFVAMFIDKKKAQKGTWRIKETTLFFLVLLRRGNRRNCRNVCI